MTHPCCNRLLCVIPPGKVLDDHETPLADLQYNEVYLVLRKCDMDLKKLIKSGKHLEETQVKSIVYDILCGLNYLHKAKIIHRDLKSNNIFLYDDNFTVKIGDFGLVKHTKKGLNMEKFRTKCGTLGFMAPEMLSRASYDGQATDIFAMGVILFIMVTGRPPFREAGD